MKHALMMTAVFLGLSGAGMARAGDDECFVPMADWQPRESVQKMAEAQGWIVRRIKTDDGCYEIKGRDASGRGIEVKVDPATLAVVEIEYEENDDYEKSKETPPTAGALAPGGDSDEENQ